jgi:hypothetical protein
MDNETTTNTGWSWNVGNENAGSKNAGSFNTGDGNDGFGNSGNGNAGNRNSGDANAGHRNTGYGNLTHRESGIFCTEPAKIRCFNKPTDKRWEEIDHPSLDGFTLCEWVPEEYMTEEEKRNNPRFCITQGYLKSLTYQEAWAKFWKKTDEENRRKFLNLPNFDAEIFFQITGIDVSNEGAGRSGG